ncbi:MAG: DUF1653 domain-containing protein [Bacilli bacterium]|nr:DUF1653 domain-containing protein [Bacilli bacterium]
MREIALNRIYRHFKGNYYIVKEIVYDSELNEEYVLYQALYGDYKTWIRKLSMFLEKIDKNREDNIYKQEYRFELVDLNKEELK